LEELGSRLILRVKGMGLMLGVELRTRAEPYVDALIGTGILATTAGGTTIRLLPPYCIGRGDIEASIEALGAVLKS
jgi:acetylornithine/LysW-gamma-L-lysine aminotransferase